MIIETPLRDVQEVQPLIEAGADFFYCGVIDSNEVNNRKNSLLHQIRGFNDLKKATTIAHSYNKKVYVTINSNAGIIDDCILHAKKAIDSGCDGFIVTNPIIIEKLANLNKNIPIILSVLSGVYNSECLKFYLKPNVKGYCFERNVAIENMKKIIAKFPKLKATAFISGNCQNSQTMCTLHNLTTKLPINKNEGGFGEMICEGWEYLNNKSENKNCNLDRVCAKDWCALCSLYLLKDAGVEVVKIEGRSLDLKYKVEKVKLYRRTIDKLNNVSSREEFFSFCKNTYKKTHGYNCLNTDCYYRI